MIVDGISSEDLSTSLEVPSLTMVSMDGKYEVDLTGTLYVNERGGNTFNASFLISPETITAMSITLGIDGVGNFRDKFSGFCRAVVRVAKKISKIIVRVAPIIEDLLSIHEERWARMHPMHVPALRDYYKNKPPRVRRRIPKR